MSVETFIKEIKSFAMSRGVSLIINENMVEGGLWLAVLEVTNKKNRNAGRGTKVMKVLCEMCDDLGYEIGVCPMPLDKTIDRGRLYKFYEKFGFQLNKYNCEMKRKPH
jgi:hypothetical protein